MRGWFECEVQVVGCGGARSGRVLIGRLGEIGLKRIGEGRGVVNGCLHYRIAVDENGF